MATDQPGKFDKMNQEQLQQSPYICFRIRAFEYEGAAGQDRRTLGGWRFWRSRPVLENL